MTRWRDIEQVLEVQAVRGEHATEGEPPGLLLEVPHGATRRADFDALYAQLVGTYPEGLVDFFFVNTDVGAPELALAIAERYVRRVPTAAAAVIRCLVPRTFIDTNRWIDPDQGPTTSAPGEVTPGLLPYVRDPADRALLLQRYQAYRAAVSAMMDESLGQGAGRAVMVHTYAPRSVGVSVDDRIVERLHEAYAPGVVETWPLRPEVDLIDRTPEGAPLSDEALVDAVLGGLRAEGVAAEQSQTYSLVPGTMARWYADRYPRQVLCFEARRDLVVRRFEPFAEMEVDPDRVERLARPIADALYAEMASDSRP